MCVGHLGLNHFQDNFNCECFAILLDLFNSSFEVFWRYNICYA